MIFRRPRETDVICKGAGVSGQHRAGSCFSLPWLWTSFSYERCRSAEQAPGASPPACPHWQDNPASYPKQHLPLETLKDLFQQQLSVEMATIVTVDSVEKAPSLTEEVLQAVRDPAMLRFMLG